MSVSESSFGQCGCEANHATHDFHPAGPTAVHRCQRAATKVKHTYVQAGNPPAPVRGIDVYLCQECAAFHESKGTR